MTPTREQELTAAIDGLLTATDRFSDALRLSDHAPGEAYLHLVEDLRVTVETLQCLRAARMRALAVRGVT